MKFLLEFILILTLFEKRGFGLLLRPIRNQYSISKSASSSSLSSSASPSYTSSSSSTSSSSLSSTTTATATTTSSVATPASSSTSTSDMVTCSITDELGDLILVEKNRYNTRSLYWDDKKSSFKTSTEASLKFRPNIFLVMYSYLVGFLKNCFLPVGTLTEDYYTYTYWRIMQRFLSATTSVFGMQSLLLAIGGRYETIVHFPYISMTVINSIHYS